MRSCATRSRCALPVLLLAACLAGAPASEASPYGINAHIPNDDQLAAARAAGVDWVRIDFRWGWVESEPDVFDWSVYDRVVEGAERYGLEILAIMKHTPAWATDGDEDRGVPRDPDDWRDFCYRAAARYRGRIAAWEMWNEPNLDGFWAGTRSQYIFDILIVGADAIHAADDEALVAGPGLAHNMSADWEGWLDDSLRIAGDHLDVATHHAYPADGRAGQVTDALEDGGSLPWEQESVKTILHESGWWPRPVWLTETGVRSTTHGESTQADFYWNLLYDWFRPDGPRRWLERIFFYKLQDDPGHPEESSGILGPPPESERKDAFYAYRDFVDTMDIDAADIVEVTLPRFAAWGSEIVAEVRVRNTGGSWWKPIESYSLGVTVGWEGFGVVGTEFPSSRAVLPGDEITFPLVLTAPPPAGQPQGAAVVSVDLGMLDTFGRRFGEGRRYRVQLSDDTPPEIVGQPGSRAAAIGDSVSFSVAVFSESEPTFQWTHNGGELADGARYGGTTGPVLTIHDVRSADAGDYRCLVTNAAGTLPSRRAPLHLLGGSAQTPRTSQRAGDGISSVLGRLSNLWGSPAWPRPPAD